MTTPLRCVLAVAFVVCALPVEGQRLITGRAEDAATGTVLSNVLAASGESRTVTGPDGRFVLRVANPRVTFARLGYSPETLTVAAITDTVVVRLRAAPIRLSATLIHGEQGFAAASSGVVRAFDLQSRPRASSQELLRLVPGLVVTQHAGGGKAEQIFLRGFDADHGTDVAITVDGMPVNLVSHAHGQGYADLHFLIPEVVERLEVRKGPYDVRDGDLGVAGSVGFVTRDRVLAPSVALVAGSFGQRTATLMAPFGGDAVGAGGYLAVQGTASDGPFLMPQGLRRYNAFAKVTAPWRGARVSVSASAFDSRWNASGQVPERAVARGLISRFGAIDSSEGGSTARANLVASVQGGTPLTTAWEARAFASRYDFQLFSNFTFYADDSARGDGIEQLDRRVLGGVQLSAERLRAFGGLMGSWRAGLGARADAADVGLFGATGRLRVATRTNDHVQVANPYALLERTSELGAGVRLALGARMDGFLFAAADCSTGDARAPQWDAVVSPKASVAWEVSRATTVFANIGRGFHSNDARAVVVREPGARTLPVAGGAELGLRHSRGRGSVAIAAWGLDLQSELVWSGDAGATEAGGRTRRVGVDVEGRVALGDWLLADADISVARGRLRDAPRGLDRIPLAPSVTSTGGITGTPGRWVGALRWRHVGARAATEDNTVRALGAFLVDASVRRTLGRLELQVAVDNVLNRSWNEAQFATTSRLRGESTAVTERHFTPGAPRSLVVRVTRTLRG